PELQAQAKIPEWLKKVLSPAVFLAWLLELLPLLLRALLAGLAALLSALVLPPGGVVWRLPPELTHQLGGIGQAHAVLVQLADAVLAVRYALVGLLLVLGGWLRVALVDVLLLAAPVLAVLWVLPLTAEWGEWALRLFGNLLAGQWLQVLALWLGGQLLLAPAPDLG